MSAVRRVPSDTPVLNMRTTECVPELGVSWQLAQEPRCKGRRSSSLKPATPLMLNGLLLKICSPRAIEARARFCGLGAAGGGGAGRPRAGGGGGGVGRSRLRQAPKIAITLRLKGATVW